MITRLMRSSVAEDVKRLLVAESQAAVDPLDLADDEPLAGELLRLDSLRLLGALLLLEEVLDVRLPDDLFVGRSFHVVGDVVQVVLDGLEGVR